MRELRLLLVKELSLRPNTGAFLPLPESEIKKRFRHHEYNPSIVLLYFNPINQNTVMFVYELLFLLSLKSLNLLLSVKPTPSKTPCDCHPKKRFRLLNWPTPGSHTSLRTKGLMNSFCQKRREHRSNPQAWSGKKRSS